MSTVRTEPEVDAFFLSGAGSSAPRVLNLRNGKGRRFSHGLHFQLNRPSNMTVARSAVLIHDYVKGQSLWSHGSTKLKTKLNGI
jgi:hypothetical protein